MIAGGLPPTADPAAAAGPVMNSLARAAEAIWQAVTPLLPGFTVEVVPELDSTNSELMRRARAGRLEPVLLVAARQSAGRGRLGRAWQSEPGASLTCSLGLPLAPADWSGLSLAVGVTLAESLHPDIRLKWPNDLWLQDRKLAGILIETASNGPGTGRSAVVGVGINLEPPAAADALSTPPAGLRALLPAIDAGGALERIAAPLVGGLLAFERAGFAPFRPGFEARDALRGRRVVLSDGREGQALGTNEFGALIVHTGLAVHTVVSSEVSVRPA